MQNAAKASILKSFRTLPGVGKVIAEDLWNMGYRALEDLKGEDPEEMYIQLEELAGQHVDRCMLYVFRCVNYCVNNKERDPHLEKWWSWKD
ncbi:helix-hairpin-helix domain-containing protein [Maridesulfovibrio frigidus]|uniref:helix-hairpin-helix domain-containing protein n=1 Tax=Maridesulfovibrio frigidus TaxID=340956 RepID=UPI001B803464|nr:helix-hairpin-helix domain-containing protein [Maridesulfovibrio frigidus]